MTELKTYCDICRGLIGEGELNTMELNADGLMDCCNSCFSEIATFIETLKDKNSLPF